MFAMHGKSVSGIFLFIVLSSCSSVMKATIENRGSTTVELSALCGDSMYKASLLSAGTTTWEPVANSCSIEIRGASAGRRLTIRNECRHATGCSIGVMLPTRVRTQLAGSGQLAIVGDIVMVESPSVP
jgi:hypothetical protein